MAIQIRGGQIKSATVTGTQLATGAINNSNLFGSGVVNAAALASDSVVSAKIADGAIDSAAYLANAVVTAGKIDLTGSFDFSSGTLRAATPSSNTDVANKAYVDSIQSGIHWKESVIAASAANVDLSSAPAAIDGVTLSTDDRVLIKSQTTASQNGIYVFAGAGSAMSRATDADSAAELNGAAVFVQQGSTSADMGFIQTAQIGNLGSDTVTFTQFTGLGQITAGDGLQKTANTISVDLSANSGLQIASGELELNAGQGVELSGGALKAKLDGSTLALSASGLKVGTITSAEIGANAVTGNAIADGAVGDSAMLADSVVSSSKIASNAITEAKVATGAISLNKLASNSVDASKIATSVAGSGLSGGGGSALSVDVDGSSIEIGGSGLNVKSAGIVAAMLASNSVETAKVSDDAITAAKIGARFFQEGFQVSGSSTSTFDLSRAIDSGFFAGVQVYVNGLAMLNNTATGDTPSNNSDYSVANNGAGSVGRISFGANLENGDSVVCAYFT
jgi:hypothetical protein